MTRSFFVCECENVEHQFSILYDYDPEYPRAYITTHLTTGGFRHRLKQAIKYLFGYKSDYGHFDETILTPEELKRLADEAIQAYKIMICHGKQSG